MIDSFLKALSVIIHIEVVLFFIFLLSVLMGIVKVLKAVEKKVNRELDELKTQKKKRGVKDGNKSYN